MDSVAAGVVAVEEAEAVEVVMPIQTPPNNQARPLQGRSIRVQSILTSHPETGRGAPCISGGGGELFSVVNRQPVHGRMSTLPNLKNETVTSSNLQLIMT